MRQLLEEVVPQMGRGEDPSSLEGQGEDAEGGLRGPWTPEQSGLWEAIGWKEHMLHFLTSGSQRDWGTWYRQLTS